MPKRVDFTGQVIGEVRVVTYLGEYKYACVCSCGETYTANYQHLTKSLNPNCGCTPQTRKPRIDLSGKRFGKLQVLSYAKRSNWRCLCDCGKETIVNSQNLKKGATKSCGCGRGLFDLNGMKFGRWTVLSKVTVAERKTYYGSKYLCQCECGTIREVYASALNKIEGAAGRSASCGCLMREIVTKMRTTHGKTNTSQFQMWQNAKNRAKAKKLPFTISVDDIVTPATCPLLGIPLLASKVKKNPGSPSLDRILPHRGYVKGNIQVISDKANTIKNNSSFVDFEKIYLNWKATISRTDLSELLR